MYREPAIPSGAPAPTEFVYAPEGGWAERIRFLGTMLVPAVFALVLAGGVVVFQLSLVVSALLALAVSAPTVLLLSRTVFRPRLTRLRVDGHALEVWTPKAKAPVQVRLADLLDVALDSEVIERVIDGPSAIPAVRFANARVAPALDVARIVLAFRDGTELPLTPERLSHLQTSEVYGRMRVFLRKHGWRPADEVEGC